MQQLVLSDLGSSERIEEGEQAVCRACVGRAGRHTRCRCGVYLQSELVHKGT